MTKLPLLLLLAYCFLAHSSANGSEFLSIATLVVGGAGPEAKTENNEDIPESFYATNIEIIECSELRRKALNHVHSQHPEQREADVNVKVIRKKNSRFINIIAISSDPRFAQLFLDGLVDEFMFLRQSVTERSHHQWLTVHAEEIVRFENLKKEVEQKLAQAELSKLPEWEIERLKLDLDYYQKTASTMLTKVRAQQAIFDKRVDPISIVDRASAAVLNKAK